MHTGRVVITTVAAAGLSWPAALAGPTAIADPVQACRASTSFKAGCLAADSDGLGLGRHRLVGHACERNWSPRHAAGGSPWRLVMEDAAA